MDGKLIAKALRAAADGQVAPFHMNGATWSGNAYEVAKSNAASYRLMADVFDKAAEMDAPPPAFPSEQRIREIIREELVAHHVVIDSSDDL